MLNDLRSPWPKKQELTTNEKEEEGEERRTRRKIYGQEVTSFGCCTFFFFMFYYLFSDVLDDGKNFLIMEELRGLARTGNIFPDFCAGLPGSTPP